MRPVSGWSKILTDPEASFGGPAATFKQRRFPASGRPDKMATNSPWATDSRGLLHGRVDAVIGQRNATVAVHERNCVAVRIHRVPPSKFETMP